MNRNSPAVTEQEPVRPLNKDEFNQIRQLAYDKFGLHLQEGKEHLVAGRLFKALRKDNFRSFREYYRHVLADTTGEALASLIDALTTNFTSFFREPEHFDFLRRVVAPTLRERNPAPVWSCACATGEEPYSIAVTLLEELGEGADSRVRILATDISNRALSVARAGAYQSERFESFSKERLRKYVLRGRGKWQGWYRFQPAVLGTVQFERLNLIEPFPQVGQFPLILCRNVMIYFDKATQTRLVNRLADCLEPGGYLFIGHSESLGGIACPLEYVKPAIYRKAEAGRVAGRIRR